MLFCLAEHIRPYRELDRGLAKVLARALCLPGKFATQPVAPVSANSSWPASDLRGWWRNWVDQLRRQFDVVDCVSEFGRVLSALTIGACTEY